MKKLAKKLNQINTLNNVLERCINEAKPIWLEAIKDLLSQDHAVALAFIGWTPGFNDGDACTHSEEIYFITTDHIKEYEKNTGETFSSSDLMSQITEIGDSYTGEREEDRKKLNLFDSPKLNFMEREYETNYKVVFTLKNDELIKNHEWYDCGY